MPTTASIPLKGKWCYW